MHNGKEKKHNGDKGKYNVTIHDAEGNLEETLNNATDLKQSYKQLKLKDSSGVERSFSGFWYKTTKVEDAPE